MQKKHKTRLNRNVHWAWQVTTVDCAQIDANVAWVRQRASLGNWPHILMAAENGNPASLPFCAFVLVALCVSRISCAQMLLLQMTLDCSVSDRLLNQPSAAESQIHCKSFLSVWLLFPLNCSYYKWPWIVLIFFLCDCCFVWIALKRIIHRLLCVLRLVKQSSAAEFTAFWVVASIQ